MNINVQKNMSEEGHEIIQKYQDMFCSHFQVIIHNRYLRIEDSISV